MAALTKTQGTSLIAAQTVTHPNTIQSSDQDVSTKLAATILMWHGSVEATANTNPGSFLVQVASDSSADDNWATVAKFTANNGTADTVGITSITGAAITCDGTPTGFAAGDIVTIQDAGDGSNNEWAEVESISGSVVTVFDNVTGTFDGSDVLWNDAERWVCQLDLTAVGRLRVLFTHEGTTGANCAIQARMVTGDSIA